MPLSLVHNVEFHLLLFQINLVREVDLVLNTRRRATLYTNAAFEVLPPLRSPQVKICYLLIVDGSDSDENYVGYRSGAVSTLSAELVASFAPRATYIAHGEAFAPLFALIEEQDILRDTSLLMFLDNFGVISCLCKGSSVVHDFGCIIHAIHLGLATLGVSAWFEHVDTHANAADGGSRGSSAVAQALGITLLNKPSPLWPKDTLAAGPSEWMSWLNHAFHGSTLPSSSV